MTVSAISPYPGGNAGNVTVEIDGTNFTPAATASLTLAAPPSMPPSIDFVSASQIFATFDLAGAAVGNYTLSVHQGSQVGDGAEHRSRWWPPPGLAERQPEHAAVRPRRVGPARIVISYTNTTDNDIVAPLLDISSTNANVFFSTPDDPNNYTQDGRGPGRGPERPGGHPAARPERPAHSDPACPTTQSMAIRSRCR